MVRKVAEKTHPAIAPNLLNRRFEVSHPNHVWASDITYIMSAEGWQFLCVFIDLYSRQIVGWAMDKYMRSELVETALKRALWARKPPKGLMVHTDQGSQFVSHSYRGLLKAWGIRQSMSRRGNCWDNAVTESFFKTLKVECVYQQEKCLPAQMMTLVVADFIGCYNHARPHSKLGYQAPAQFERNAREEQKEVS
jgi:transposase InsO family protein